MRRQPGVIEGWTSLRGCAMMSRHMRRYGGVDRVAGVGVHEAIVLLCAAACPAARGSQHPQSQRASVGQIGARRQAVGGRAGGARVGSTLHCLSPFVAPISDKRDRATTQPTMLRLGPKPLWKSVELLIVLDESLDESELENSVTQVKERRPWSSRYGPLGIGPCRAQPPHAYAN